MTIRDFYQEMVMLPILLVVILLNVWGSRANNSRAKQWAATHLPLLESEFASVGFGGGRKGPGADDVQSQGLAKAMAGSMDVPEETLKQKAKNEYFTYATGRQNVAKLDVKISLHKRYNPFLWFGEQFLSFFFDSMPAPTERVEATAWCFDGKEKEFVPNASGSKDSSYDGFVWALVHKDKMKQLRDDRYDLSLTATRDSSKLPDWATIMSESAEITDVLLTPDLVKAVNETGEDLEALIISDQPIDPPKKYNHHLLPSPTSILTLRQTQRHHPKETRLPLHASKHAPNIHSTFPILPPSARPSRISRPLPLRSDAQSPRHTRRGNEEDPEDRRRGEGGGEEGGDE